MEQGKWEVIRIIIKTVDGDDGEFKKEQSSTVEEVTTAAMARFKIDPSPGAAYRLALKKPDDQFTTLDPAKTLLDEGIKDGDTLWLGTEQVVGGSARRSPVRRPGTPGPSASGETGPASPTRRNLHGRDAIPACI